MLHVNPTGAMVKVELKARESEQLISAEVTAERFAELALRAGDTVYVAPKKVRVFLPDYSI